MDAVAKNSDGQPRKRFSKSGHASYGPRVGAPPPPPPPAYPPPNYQPPNHPPPNYQPPNHPPPNYQPPSQYGPQYGPEHGPSAPYQPPPDSFGSATYHHTPGSGRPDERPAPTTAGGAALVIGRAAL